MATLETLKVLLSDHLSFDTNEIPEVSEDTTFKSIGMDSLDQLEFVMSVEDHFRIEIPDDEANDLQTLGQIRKYLVSVGK